MQVSMVYERILTWRPCCILAKLTDLGVGVIAHATHAQVHGMARGSLRVMYEYIPTVERTATDVAYCSIVHVESMAARKKTPLW